MTRTYLRIPHGRKALFKAASAVAAAVVALIGAAVLAGWWLDIAVLKSLRPAWMTMKANTALGFLLAGLALWWLRDAPPGTRARYGGMACAGLVTMLGLLTLVEYLSGVDLGMDNALFPEPAGALLTTSPSPGRMSPMTALNFLFSGAALLLLNVGARRGRRPAEILVLPSLAVSFVAVIGYLYGVEELYRVKLFSSMALHTGVAFSLVGLGILWARPDAGWMAVVSGDTVGGRIVRLFLPVLLVIVPILSLFRLWGERAGYFGTEFGVALMVLVSVLLLSGLALWSAVALDKNEAARRQIEESLRESETDHRGLLSSLGEGVYGVDLAGRCTFINPTALAMLGYTEGEMLGQPQHDVFHHHRPDGRPYPHTECPINLTSHDGRVRRVQEWFFRRDGTGFPVDLIVTPLMKDTDRTGAVAAFSDITDRKAAEDALLRQTEELKNRNDELGRFNRAMVGRELDMVELKRQVKELSRELGRPVPNKPAFAHRPENVGGDKS